MSILATDVLIKTMLEAGLHDLRKNSWLLDDVFSGLAADPISRAEYGWKEVKRAKEWFLANNVAVYLPFRIDAPTLPCISVVGPQSSEMNERANLGDDGIAEEIVPREASAQPQRTYDPFTPVSYDKTTGYVVFPKGIQTSVMAPGQFLVSQQSGQAYVILEVIDPQTFAITTNINDDFTDAYVVPPTALWNLQRELMFMSESFTIGCHSIGDPVFIMWLRRIVLYMLGRYREAYLESRGFGISRMSASPPYIDTEFDQERVYTSNITLEGQVQADWIKYIAPKLQIVTAEIAIINGPKTPPGYQTQVQSQGWEMEGDITPPPHIPNPGDIPDDAVADPEDVPREDFDKNETEDDQ